MLGLQPSSSADIVSACFALPFERRLILGTEDGKLLLVNYVTGVILDELQPHAAEVMFGLVWFDWFGLVQLGLAWFALVCFGHFFSEN